MAQWVFSLMLKKANGNGEGERKSLRQLLFLSLFRTLQWRLRWHRTPCPASDERENRDDTISPTIPWMARRHTKEAG